MIVRIPGVTKGATCGEIVELVDLYPTLCNILEIDLPHDNLEGISFLPLVENPDLSWKKAAFTVCRQGVHLGKSVRTKSHRYTEWIDYADRDNENAAIRFSEMYDLEADSLEQNNLADLTEHSAKQKELAGLLSGGWENAIARIN